MFQEDSGFFKKRCNDVGNARLSEIQSSKSKYKATETPIKPEAISEISDNIFMVESRSDPTKFYSVDMTNGYCECEKGLSRGPCPHKHAISIHFGISEFSVLPCDPGSRAVYH